MITKISAKRKAKEKLLKALVFAAAGITGMIFIGIIVYILFRGLPHVTFGLLTSKRMIVGSVIITSVREPATILVPSEQNCTKINIPTSP